MVTDNEKMFYSIILQNKDVFENVIKESLKYKINLTKEFIDFKTNEIEIIKSNKKSIVNGYPLGLYDKSKQKFIWFPHINNLIYNNAVKNSFIEEKLKNNKNIITNLFESEVFIEQKYENVIPY